MEKLDDNAAQCSKFQWVVPITTEDPTDIFYVYGSVRPWCILVIVQRNTTKSSLFHSTCFGCQPHPPSGVHETVTTASGTGHLPPSNVAKLGHVGRK